ncbi:MAG: hypothetical protein U9Q34_06820 [Elusimicrobiota bacterium]|nr:hypothetical protein [Elusimicrobiota bacterium]
MMSSLPGIELHKESKDINKIVKSVVLKFIIFHLFLLPVLMLIVSFTVKYSKKSVAVYITSAIRENLLIGNSKEAILQLESFAIDNFSDITWKSNDGSQKFNVNSKIKTFNSVKYDSFKITLFFDLTEKQKAGELKFYYSRLNSVFFAFLIWLGFLFVSVIIGYNEKKKFLKNYRLSLKLKVMEVMSDLSAQVAHDIRSPLAALDSITKDIAKLPEEKRIIIRSAMGRIRDIANNLIEKNRQLPKDFSSKNTSTSASIEPANNYLLSSLIDPIITEKHFQFRSKTDIEIITQLDKASYGLFAKVQPIEFRRFRI